MVLTRRFRAHWLQLVVHVGAWLPLVWLGWNYWQGAFIVDPVREITTLTGRGALILLLLSLACTPIHTLFGFRPVLRVRRALGLYAFLYAGLHGATFVVLDYGLDLDLLRQTLLDQRFVLVGMAAFVLLLPLAVTSTRGWQKRLGKNWKRLHRLVYPAVVLAVVHFAWLVKDTREPWRYGAALTVLLVLRLPWFKSAARSARQKIKTRLRASRSTHLSND